jgi:hypothetical protein
MSRITAPVARLSKTLGTASASAPALRAGATLAPKYADLLRSNRVRDPSEAHRTLSTTRNPLRRPVSAAPSSPSSAPVDAAVLPNFESFSAVDSIRVPILPDNFGIAYASSAAPVIAAAGTQILAANPANVEPSSILTTVSHMGADGVELRFVHNQEARADGQIGMLQGIWNGLMGGLQPESQPALN